MLLKYRQALYIDSKLKLLNVVDDWCCNRFGECKKYGKPLFQKVCLFLPDRTLNCIFSSKLPIAKYVDYVGTLKNDLFANEETLQCKSNARFTKLQPKRV